MALYGNKNHAARRAWVLLKNEGVVTLFDKYHRRHVDILVDTGKLLKSLTPGARSGAQVFRVEAGSVTIGTKRKGALAHHQGVPGRLPQRRLWPKPANWPMSWWNDILSRVAEGLARIAVHLVEQTAR
jgi:hypothetical protein